jgi:hypothetical protein
MMLSGKGLAMVASLFGLISLWLPSPSFASPSVKVTGVLKGYFLSPDGTLKVREIPFAFPDQPAAPDLPERLFPLPAGYYLQGKFFASEPIQSVWLLSGNGRLLWRRHYPEGVLEGEMPQEAGGWIGLRGEDRLSVRLLVRFGDGRETVIRPHFPIRFEKVLPLKVDWLDFVRIAEVAHLLKEKGKEIWEGFSLEGIPFLLEGAEGQWVLINHPKPPKGFERYKGPLPKVSFPIRVYVGQREAKERQREEVMGWVEEVNGVKTVALRYYPTWWVLTECAWSAGYPTVRHPDALQRIEAILHESFHVWWFQRFGEPPALSPKGVANPLEEGEEREYLVRALTAQDEAESRQWAKAFLHARHQRRQRQGMTKEEIVDERVKEMLEGLATFVSWQAIKVAKSGGYQPLKVLKADPEFFSYEFSIHQVGDEQVLIDTLQLKRSALGHAHAFGLAQAILLERWDRRWRRKVPAKDLEALLEEAVAKSPLPKEVLERKGTEDRKEGMATENSEGEKVQAMTPPHPSVTIWLSLPKGLLEEMERFCERYGAFPLEAQLSLETDAMTAVVEPPVWMRVDKGQGRLGILWDRSKQLSLHCHPDGFVTLQGAGLRIQGKLTVQREKDGVFLHPTEKAQKTPQGSVFGMRGKKASHALMSPMVLIWESNGNGQEGLIGVTGDLSGVFRAATGGLAYETLPLAGSAPDGVERYFVTDEVYTGRLTAWHADADPFEVTFWVIVSWTWQEGIESYWTVTGAATGYSGGTLLAFAVSLSPDPQQQERKKLRVKFRYRDSKGREWETEVEYESVKTPPTGNLKVYGALLDAETGKSEPLGVWGNIWRKSKPDEVKVGFNAKQGQDTVQLAPAPDYTAEATGRESRSQLAMCRPPLKSGPEEFGVAANETGSIGFLFIVHQGISGMVWERQSDGSLVPLPGATVEVFKGDQRIYSTQSESTKGIVGSFMIPGHIVDGWLNQYGDSSFTVKVTPPNRSMMQPNPPFIPRDTPTITKCRRRKTGESCPRDTTINLGDFIFTYQPPQQPPGGG